MGKLTAVFDKSVSDEARAYIQGIVDGINSQTALEVPNRTLTYTSDAEAYANISPTFRNATARTEEGVVKLYDSQNKTAFEGLGGRTTDQTIFINPLFDPQQYGQTPEFTAFHETIHGLVPGLAGAGGRYDFVHKSDFYLYEKRMAEETGRPFPEEEFNKLNAALIREGEIPLPPPRPAEFRRSGSEAKPESSDDDAGQPPAQYAPASNVPAGDAGLRRQDTNSLFSHRAFRAFSPLMLSP